MNLSKKKKKISYIRDVDVSYSNFEDFFDEEILFMVIENPKGNWRNNHEKESENLIKKVKILDQLVIDVEIFVSLLSRMIWT